MPPKRKSSSKGAPKEKRSKQEVEEPTQSSRGRRKEDVTRPTQDVDSDEQLSAVSTQSNYGSSIQPSVSDSIVNPNTGSTPAFNGKRDAVKKSNKKEPKKAAKEKGTSEEESVIPVYPGRSISETAPQKSADGKTWNLKLVSWNVNGLRAWIKTNSLSYLTSESPDVMGIQETKCGQEKLPKEATDIAGFESFWSSADKEGYAGTALYSKLKPIKVTYGIGQKKHDAEGRVITAEYDKFFFVTAYVPNSGRDLVRLTYREKEWDPDFTAYLKALDAQKPIIVCGDLNVAHNEIDLANPASNQKTAGFTKQERAGFTKLLQAVDVLDSYRHLYPDRTGAYSFWSYMRGARSKNTGWRLDYFLISRRLMPNLCDHEIRSSVMGSDHCPIVLYMHF